MEQATERERAERALARIEHAFARAESASQRISATQPLGLHASKPAIDDGLARRHEDLRACVTSSLNDLDALIGALEG
jgi:hypothetical protein